MKKTWRGKYHYLDENDSTIRSVGFEIRADYFEHSFRGKAYEDEFSKATGELVEVKGFFDVDYVSFVKTYPYGWTLNEKSEVILLKDQPGHEVKYFGRLNSESLFWEGDWEVEIENQLDPKNPGSIETTVFSGMWEMKLVEQEKEF